MYKRLLALLVFVPMFLLAWYARSNRHPGSGPVPSEREEVPARDSSGSRDSRNREGGRAREEASRGQAGNFDFYLLNLSWSPEFCATHPGKPECDSAPGFVLHGLWPQNNDGSYPEHCSDASGPSDPSAFADILPDAGLLRHEWATHGTCSGLSPEAYFKQARAAFQALKVPEVLDHGEGSTSMTPEAILTAFTRSNPSVPRESFSLSCGNNYLTAVEVCLDRGLHAIACSDVRSCRANSVRIVPRGAGR